MEEITAYFKPLDQAEINRLSNAQEALFTWAREAKSQIIALRQKTAQQILRCRSASRKLQREKFDLFIQNICTKLEQEERNRETNFRAICREHALTIAEAALQLLHRETRDGAAALLASSIDTALNSLLADYPYEILVQSPLENEKALTELSKKWKVPVRALALKAVHDAAIIARSGKIFLSIEREISAAVREVAPSAALGSDESYG